jgi:DNA invertase Pin-like site-specific DNA recombinase
MCQGVDRGAIPRCTLDALEKAGCEPARIYKDKLSGLKSKRPGLDEALGQLRPGDVFVVWKLDRLCRSVKGLVDFVAELETQEVQFKSLTDGIDTTTPTGRFSFTSWASLAQMERELLAERTKAGLAAARKRGRVGGRKKSMTQSRLKAVRKLLGDGMPPKEVAENLGVSIPMLYRWPPASER